MRDTESKYQAEVRIHGTIWGKQVAGERRAHLPNYYCWFRVQFDPPSDTGDTYQASNAEVTLNKAHVMWQIRIRPAAQTGALKRLH